MPNWYEESFWNEQLKVLQSLQSNSEQSAQDFLQTFSNIYSLLDDAWLDAYIRYCRNNINEVAIQQLEFVESTVMPMFENGFARLKQKFLQDHKVEGFEHIALNFKASLEPYSTKNESLNSDERDLIRQYNKITSDFVVDVSGGISTWKAWRLISESKFQKTRKEIYKKLFEARSACAFEVADIFSSLVPLRKQQAKNAGFSNYIDFAWQLRQRSDYSYQEAIAWSVELSEVFNPSYSLLYERLKKIHGVPKICAWDLPPAIKNSDVIPEHDYKSAIKFAFRKIDPEFEQIISKMDNDGDMDIMHREHKSGGNFGYGFKLEKRVGLSGNTVGSISDISVLLHECGHAIHYYYTNDQQLSWNQEVCSEIAEFIAYLFQCLASDLLIESGFISSEQANQYKHIIADGILDTFRGVAERDLFERAVYSSNKDLSPFEINDLFLTAHIKPPYEELESSLEFYWQTYPTIVTKPFSGIEYSLAWLCTLLVLDRFKENRAVLIPKLKELMRAGNSIGMEESLNLVGITLPFSKDDFARARIVFEREFLGNL